MMLSLSKRAALALVVTTLVGLGCDAGESDSSTKTGLRVALMADESVRSQLTRVELSVINESTGEVVFSVNVPDEHPINPATIFLADDGALPPEKYFGDIDPRVVQVVTAPSETVIVTAKARSATSGSISKRVKLRFPTEPRQLNIELDAPCLAVACAENQTCARGQCISSTIDAASLTLLNPL